MCNSRHPVFLNPKRKSGKGYKIVRGYLAGQLTPIMNPTPYVRSLDNEGWITWNSSEWTVAPDVVLGFCMFRTLKEAKRALNAWQDYPWLSRDSYRKDCWICPVEYRQAIAFQDENNFITGYSFQVLLAKEWRPILKED